MAKSAAADKTKHKPKPANLQLCFFFIRWEDILWFRDILFCVYFIYIWDRERHYFEMF